MFLILVAVLVLQPVPAEMVGFYPPPEAPTQDDIDDFMAKVLRQRSHNWDSQYNYSFCERESLEITSSIAAAPIQGFTGEYLWYVRDGYLVRSPVSVNGAQVPDEERTEQEDKWIESLKKGKTEGGGLERDRFFGMDFKKGEFFYAGRTEHEGREVAVIEFYSDGVFGDEGDDDDNDELDERIERGLDKTMMVTLYVIPEDHQIVRMTLDNAGFDFLPGRWLVRVEKIAASMTMHQPYGDEWLPQEMVAYGTVTTAQGSLSVRYTRLFYDYRVSEVRVKFRFPPRSEKK